MTNGSAVQLVAVPALEAGIHCGDQNESSRISDRTRGVGNRNHVTLQRLAQSL